MYVWNERNKCNVWRLVLKLKVIEQSCDSSNKLIKQLLVSLLVILPSLSEFWTILANYPYTVSYYNSEGFIS